MDPTYSPAALPQNCDRIFQVRGGGWFVGWLAGLLVGGLACWLVLALFGGLVCYLFGWLAGSLVVYLDRWLAGLAASYLVCGPGVLLSRWLSG